MKETLEMLLERLRKFRSLYEQNEMAVRDQIINPILRKFGWDPENPDDVQPNISSEEGVPDYSLIKDGKKVLFIEAKKLSIDVEQKDVIRQLARYCFGEGMKYGILTNGSVWILFRAFQEGTTMADRVVWKADIENEDLSASIRKLNTISKQDIENIEKLIKKINILDEIWQALMDEPGEMIAGLIPVFMKLINEGYPEYEFKSGEIEDFLQERISELISVPDPGPLFQHQPVQPPETFAPRNIAIGSNNYSIRNAYDILIHTAEWLISNGKLKKSECPIRIGRKRYLINIEPKHPHREFINPKQLSNGLYVDCNISKATAITNARDLLKKYSYREDTLRVL